MNEHFVQFYENDAYLLNQVAVFIRTGLHAGDAAIVLATQAHRDGLEKRLKADVARAAALYPESESSFTVLDADESLACIMADGQPDERRFIELLEPVLQRARQGGGRRLRVFGELVSVLCAKGQHEAAICLEGFWNNLSRVHPMSLFCAYPMGVFPHKEHADAFARVCNAHSRVSPAESYTPPANAHEHYRAIAVLQQKAIALETEVARRKELEKTLHGRENQLTVSP